MSEHHDITVAQRMLAACSGSLLTGMVVTPFDVVRVRMQQQSAWRPHLGLLNLKTHPVEFVPKGVGITSCCREVFWMPNSIDYCVAVSNIDSCAVEEAQKRRFTGTWDGIKKIVQYEGISTLWRGISLTLISAIPSNVVYFTAYEYMRDNSPIHSSFMNPLICGGLARSISATVISPLELAKTRQQGAVTGSGSNTNEIFRGVGTMVRNEGVLSLWRGLVLTLWRDVPFSAIYWGCVEYVRGELSKYPYFQHHPDSTFMKSFLAGSIGGTIAALMTSPFDVGKTRRQLDPSAASHEKRMIPYMLHIVRNEGVSALFVGAVPRMLKVAPACAIMITSYEMGKKVFGEKNREALRLSASNKGEA